MGDFKERVILEAVDKVSKTVNAIETNLSNSQKRIQGANDKVKQSQDKIAQSSSKLQDVQKNLASRFGAVALAAGGAYLAYRKIGEAIDYVNQKSQDFEKTLSSVKAIVAKNDKEFDQLANKAKQLGATTAFSASQVAQAFVEMGKLGKTTNDILASSSDVLDLAAASQADVAVSSEVLIKTMNAFNLSAGDSQKVVDVMAKSFSSSALDITKFQESMKLVGTSARLVGLDLETTTALLGVLADNSIEASMGGTSLNQALIQMTDPSSKVNKLFKSLGVESAGFTEKMEVLRKQNIDVGETFGLLDVRAARALNILMGNKDAVDLLEKSLRNADGTGKMMAKTMLDNVAGASVILESAQESLAITVGETFAKEKRDRIEFYTEAIGQANEMVKSHENILSNFAKVMSDVITGTVRLGIAAVNVATIVVDSISLLSNNFIAAIFDSMRATVEAMNNVASFFGKKEELFDLSFLINQTNEFGAAADAAAINLQKMFSGGFVSEQTQRQAEAEEKLADAIAKRSGREADARKQAEQGGGSTGAGDVDKGQVALQYKIQELIASSQEDSREKEIELLKIHHQERMNVVLNAAAKEQSFRSAAEENFAYELSEINKQWDEKNAQLHHQNALKKIEIDSMLNSAQVDSREKDLENVRLKYEKERLLAEEDLQLKLALKEQERFELSEVNKRWNDTDKELTKRNNEEIAAETKKRFDELQSKVNASISGISSFTNALGNLASVRADNEARAAKAAGKSEEEIQKIRKESFEKQKKYQYAQAIGNIALGITNAIARGGILGAIEGVAIGAAGAVQLKTIQETKGYAQGGLITGRDVMIRANEREQEGVLTGRGLQSIGGQGGLNAANNGTNKTVHITNQISFTNSFDIGKDPAQNLIGVLGQQKEELAELLRDMQMQGTY